MFYATILSGLVYLFYVTPVLLLWTLNRCSFKFSKRNKKFINKGMSDLLLRKTHLLKFWAFQVWEICLQVSFWGAPTHAHIAEFYNFLLQLKIQVWKKKRVSPFYWFTFERNYDVLKSCFLSNKKLNFKKAGKLFLCLPQK